MEARFQISTRSGMTHFLACPPSSQSVQPAVRFTTDSKALSSLLPPYVQAQHSLILTNGPERAFTEMPAKLIVHSEAARRDQ